MGNSVAIDIAGNVVVTGYFEGTVDFGGGPASGTDGDMFVVKFSPDGSHLWNQELFAGGMFNEGNSVAVDGSGNVVATGYRVDWGGPPPTGFNYDVVVTRFDADGNILWNQTFGDNDYQEGKSVAVDGSGNIVVTGGFASTIYFGGVLLTSAGHNDIFVVKFDAGGTPIWSKGFGDDGDQVGKSVAVDAAGSIVITGDFAGTVDFGGGPITSAHPYYTDVFLATFDAGGNHVWSRGFGDANPQASHSVAADDAGDSSSREC